jgi:hypothetical protein
LDQDWKPVEASYHGTTTFTQVTLSLTTLCIMTFSKMTLGTATPSRTTFSIMRLITTFSINNFFG